MKFIASALFTTAIICLSGLSMASPIAAAADDSNNVAAVTDNNDITTPNRNIPQKIEPYVDFGINGFLYKKRNVPIANKRAANTQGVEKRYYARTTKTPKGETEADSKSIGGDNNSDNKA